MPIVDIEQHGNDVISALSAGRFFAPTLKKPDATAILLSRCFATKIGTTLQMIDP